MTEIAHTSFARGHLPSGWELGRINCIPKASGLAFVSRLRPIALQDTKKKWSLNVVTLQIEQTFRRLTHKQQVGCVKGRQMIHHIWGGQKGFHSLDKCVLVNFDFSNAFPTLSHSFIEAVLRTIQIPSHYFKSVTCVFCDFLSPKAVYRVSCPFFRPKMFSPGDCVWCHSHTLIAHVLANVVGPSPNGPQLCHIQFIPMFIMSTLISLYHFCVGRGVVKEILLRPRARIGQGDPLPHHFYSRSVCPLFYLSLMS